MQKRASRANAEKHSRLLAAMSYQNRNGIDRWASTVAYAISMMDLYVPHCERTELEQISLQLDALAKRAQKEES